MLYTYNCIYDRYIYTCIYIHIICLLYSVILYSVSNISYLNGWIYIYMDFRVDDMIMSTYILYILHYLAQCSSLATKKFKHSRMISWALLGGFSDQSSVGEPVNYSGVSRKQWCQPTSPLKVHVVKEFALSQRFSRLGKCCNLPR